LWEARRQHAETVGREIRTRLAAERQQARQEAGRLRCAVLRVLPDAGPAAAAALLEAGARPIRTYVGDELGWVVGALEAFNPVAALHVRETLHRLGVPDPDRYRLVDLQPPQKRRRLNRQGRPLVITAELLISSSTGISRSLADPAKIAALRPGTSASCGAASRATRRRYLPSTTMGCSTAACVSAGASWMSTRRGLVPPRRPPPP
jgi:hypothetical protein